ncbi:AAA family ATPase [Hymenobacter nivis]|nr:AAA family ATPase [Hymenobacter nivis]
MIKSVRLVNFFSFGDCTIELEPDLNVLVGVNGSGKSNLLRAFQLLKAGINGRLQEQVAQWGGLNSIHPKNLVRPIIHRQIEVAFTLSVDVIGPWKDGYEDDIVYRIVLLGNANDFTVDEVVERPDGQRYFDSLGGSIFASAIAIVERTGITRRKLGNGKELLVPTLAFEEAFGESSFIRFHLGGLDVYKAFNTIEEAPMRTAVRATGIDKLLPNGDNVFQVLNVTSLKSAPDYDAIEAGLQDVNEQFQRFRMNVYGQGSVEFYLQEKGLDTPIHAAQVSDGTLCYLCLLVALYQPERGRVTVFDEPERNLHPDMLVELGKQLEKASKRRQIILTTHAPGLLNQFPLRAVRVFEKDEYNQTQVRQFTEADFAGWYEEFAPGQMWRDGALGGNRY